EHPPFHRPFNHLAELLPRLDKAIAQHHYFWSEQGDHVGQSQPNIFRRTFEEVEGKFIPLFDLCVKSSKERFHITIVNVLKALADGLALPHQGRHRHQSLQAALIAAVAEGARRINGYMPKLTGDQTIPGHKLT